MTKTACLSRFSLLTAFLFVALTLRSQNFPPVTPQNMNAVVAEIYAQFGSQIQVQPDQMTAFLRHLQPNYTPSIGTPQPTAISSTPTSLTFAWSGPDNQTTAVGVLNTLDNQQSTDLTSQPTYTFNELNNHDLYLFAFVNTQANKQGSIQVIVAPVGFIIIVDEKIMFTNECSTMSQVGTGNNQVTVPLSPNDGAFFQVSTKTCSNATGGSDLFYLWLENQNGTISGILVPNLAANSDNYIMPNSNNIASQNTGASTLSFRAIYNSSIFQYDQFRVSNAVAGSLCTRITVKRCLGSGEQHPTTERTATDDLLRAGVFPNPVRDVAHLILPGKNLQNARIVLVNCLGSLVKTVPVIQEDTTVEMTGLAPGLYYINVVLAAETIPFKVLKIAE